MNEGLERRLKETVHRFRVLQHWTVEIEKTEPQEYGRTFFTPGASRAFVAPWWPGEQEPADYLLHEVLHIAIRAAIGDHEREELLVQDLCVMYHGARSEA